MADVSMKDFLTQYFMQRVFNAMPEEQFAQYQSIIKNNDFIGNMKDWKDKWKLVVEDNGKWVKNEVDPAPDTFGLIPGDADAEKEWEKLYKELRNAFRKVATGRDNLDPKDDAKTITFLNNFYGFGQLFTPSELIGPAADQLNNELLPFMKSNKTNLYQALKDIGIYTDTEKKFSDFINDLSKGKHNTDNEVRDMLAHIISYLQSSYYGPAITERMGGAQIPNLEVLANGLENDDVDPSKLQIFKDNYKLVLNPIYSEKNIYQNFGPHLKSVKDAIETAKKRIDYNNPDSKDFLPEKREDKKGPIEERVDKIKGWWGDHTDKYTSLHKSRLFYSEEAKAIAKAIDGSKFKATDGLDKFVESLKDIGSKVKGNKAKQHFKWFSETMTKLQGDKQMKSIFAGALKNPRKLKELAAEIAIQGLKDGKKDEEIFTAMEVLKTIQYGYATSNHLNAVMSQDLTLFGDKNLSWNKHEGMKFVMTSLDKTINWGIKGTALAITTGYNIANRNIGNKFKGEESKRQIAAHTEYIKNRTTERNFAEQQFNLLRNRDSHLKGQYHLELQQLQLNYGINDATLSQKEQWLEGLQGNIDRRKEYRDTAQASLQTAQQDLTSAQSDFDATDNIIKSHRDKEAQLATLKKNLKNLQARIRRYNTKPQPLQPIDAARLNALAQQESALYEQINQQKAIIAQGLPGYNAATTDIVHLQNVLNNKEQSYNIAESNLQTAQQRYLDLQNRAADWDRKINSFKNATQGLHEVQERMDKRAQEWSQWDAKHPDRFARLMAHWDFLNSGRMRTGENVLRQTLEGILPLSQKARQGRYDKRKINVHSAFLAQYQNKYGMTA